jgi:uncharacterized protein (DUF849 family)
MTVIDRVSRPRKGRVVHEKLMIQARINEYTMRDTSPHVPYSPEEIARDALACWRAGASVVHFHARDPVTGAASGDTDLYAEAVRLIRAESDLITMPTLGAYVSQTGEGRLDHILKMAGDPMTKPDCVPLDMLTANVDVYDPVAKDFTTDDMIYTNTTATLKHLARTVRSVGVKPVAELWTVASVRCTEAFVEMGLFEEPLFCELPLLEGGLLAGHPGTVRGMEALLDFVPPRADWNWFVLTTGGNLFAVAAAAMERGGHVSIGAGDYPYPELGYPTNPELVTRVADLARSIGREVASAAEAREALDIA